MLSSSPTIPLSNLTLLKYRNPNPDPDPKTKEVPKVTSEVTSENLFERWTARRNYFYLEHRISHGCAKAARSADRQLVEIPGSSKALISLNYNITPTLTLTLLKYPYPNLNLTLIQKLKLSVKLDSYSDFRRLNKFSTSCRVPNKCMTLGYSNTAVYVVYAHNAKCTWTDGYRELL